MFTVSPDGLLGAWDRMRQAYVRLSDQLDETVAVRRRLEGCAGLETPLEDLRRAERSLEERLVLWGQFMQALERSAEMYRRYEASVADAADSRPLRRAVPSWGTADLLQVAESMKDVVWE